MSLGGCGGCGVVASGVVGEAGVQAFFVSAGSGVHHRPLVLLLLVRDGSSRARG